MQKIFFFDIDGTLAIHGHIPQSNLEALNQLKKKGYLTFNVQEGRLFMLKKCLKILSVAILHVMVDISPIKGRNYMEKHFHRVN